MKQKRFVKRLMGLGYSAQGAKELVEYIKELRHKIERRDRFILFADEKMELVPAKAYSYDEIFRRITKGQSFLW